LLAALATRSGPGITGALVELAQLAGYGATLDGESTPFEPPAAGLQALQQILQPGLPSATG